MTEPAVTGQADPTGSTDNVTIATAGTGGQLDQASSVPAPSPGGVVTGDSAGEVAAELITDPAQPTS